MGSKHDLFHTFRDINKTTVKIITHEGDFDADDVFGLALLIVTFGYGSLFKLVRKSEVQEEDVDENTILFKVPHSKDLDSFAIENSEDALACCEMAMEKDVGISQYGREYDEILEILQDASSSLIFLKMLRRFKNQGRLDDKTALQAAVGWLIYAVGCWTSDREAETIVSNLGFYE